MHRSSLSLGCLVAVLLSACGSLYAADVTKPKGPEYKKGEKEFTVNSRYLILPIDDRNKDGQGKISLFIDGKEVRRYGLKLAASAATTEWYAFFTIKDYKGKKARVVASKVTDEGFALVKQANKIPGQEKFYTEPHRPQFHFTQKVGWINDPNGLVYQDGVWHFFFQHNPVSRNWGNMTWGHATSKDLMHWTQQPNKLFPTTMAKKACFSGSATIDHNNTAGWGKGTLVAFFTDTGCGECIAYSTDKGKTFTYYEKNPVVKHRGRDPKVSWYAYDENDKPLNAKAKALGGHWVMTVYDENKKDGRNAAFYTSTNMKEWTEQSHLPGYYECTDLIELPVDGDKNNTRWVVYAADARYAVGQFDGKTFTPDHKNKRRVHYGNYYASQTFDNTPEGRKIQIGWAKIGTAKPFNQMFTFPHRLTLKKTKTGIRLFANPIREIEQLRTKTHTLKAQPLQADKPVSLPVSGELFDINARFNIGLAKEIVLTVGKATITYNVAKKKLHNADLTPINGTIGVRVLFDRGIMEIIGNDGRFFITAAQKQQGKVNTIQVEAKGGNASLLNFDAHELKSTWATKK